MRLKHTLKTKIQGTFEYDLFSAAIAAGATLDELFKLQSGEYPGWFKAQILIWYQNSRLSEAHAKDAEIDEIKKKS